MAENSSIIKLQRAARDGTLVVIFGTGSSRGLAQSDASIFSWRGLVKSGFQYGVSRGCLTAQQESNWSAHLDSDDLDELLGAAEFLSKKLRAPEGGLFSQWLRSTFSEVRHQNHELANSIAGLTSAKIPLATLNYDSLLEDVTGLPGIVVPETARVTAWMRRETPSILHLHGKWDAPDTCVLGIQDYAGTVGNSVRDLIQRSLGAFNTLLFVGCGDTFADPNFSELVKWLRKEMGTAAPLHYALVHKDDVAKRNSDPSWRGFVEPIPYEEHSDVVGNLHQIASAAQSTSSRKSTLALTHAHEIGLESYAAFLLRDCGQMTIEGVRADMDTAQRKFDLERLFVPLDVTPIPPEIPDSDPQKDQKLQTWTENNKETSFGEAFTKTKRMALLALPGGGKTLLLKRLAVAYMDKKRRKTSTDELPDLSLYPIMIRCREWRDHIDKPLPTIFENFPRIIGLQELTGFHDGIAPLLKSGKVLLLIDGLDEIHNDAHRTLFAENLEKFLEYYPKIRVVITSREAGFSLVAPTLSRFCTRYRIAALSTPAVRALSTHWHTLMIGDTPAASQEASELADKLLETPALRRLAENPLLLTMLLVVKHSAGRLPPDRVTLYERAVEVLLDTWNIKGHEALDAKEAVPQLAYLAFELLRTGRQTATEAELISLLEDARENVPQISRYATDSPHAFLKRVELRSSLLLEAGHQLVGRNTVPFYQFRHLTFQEYLAAVASVEGHYPGYNRSHDLLAPLGDRLLADEWKEVLPMAAVLARKQAEPLINALIQQAQASEEAECSQIIAEASGVTFGHYTLMKPLELLLQSLSEEAEASPDALSTALKLLAKFARGCRENPNWDALITGPYGSDFTEYAWQMYQSGELETALWVRNTAAAALAGRAVKEVREEEIVEHLRSRLINEPDNATRTLLTISGIHWSILNNFRTKRHPKQEPDLSELLPQIEIYTSSPQPILQEAALWAWGLSRKDADAPPPIELLEGLKRQYFTIQDSSVAAFALGRAMGFPRDFWQPQLTDEEKQNVNDQLNSDGDFASGSKRRGALTLAFYCKGILDDQQLVKLLTALPDKGERGIPGALKQLLPHSAVTKRRKRGQKAAD